MKTNNWGFAIVIFAVAMTLCGWGAAQVSESTRIYASLPALIEISIPDQYKDIVMDGCEPGKSVSVTCGVEIKSNSNWGLTVAGSTQSGHMIGSVTSVVHELHNPLAVSAKNPAGGPVSLPGTSSTPSEAALLSNAAPGDYSGADIIDLSFEQLFGWDDYADDNYQITATLTASPA